MHSWIFCSGQALRPQQLSRVWANLEDGENELMGWAGLLAHWSACCWSRSGDRETSTPLPCTASSSLCRFIEECGVESSSPDPVLHVSGVLLPLLAPAPRLGLPVTVVCPALHAAHPLPPGPSLHPRQHIPGRDLKLQGIPAVLESGEPPTQCWWQSPDAAGWSLCHLKRVGSVVTSLVLMLSPGGSGWCCWMESGGPWKMSGQMSAQGVRGLMCVSGGVTGSGVGRGWGL